MKTTINSQEKQLFLSKEKIAALTNVEKTEAEAALSCVPECYLAREQDQLSCVPECY